MLRLDVGVGATEMMSLQDLSPAERRRLIAIGLLRALIATTLLVVAYYLLPFSDVSKAKSVVLLVVGMLAVILIVIWEVRAILKAAHPGVKAVEALAITAPLFLLLFASAYYLMEQATPGSFSQSLSRTDALYFTVTTFSTVGYGDITAKSEGARVLVIFQMLADLILLGFGLKVIFGAVQMGRQRQTSGPADSSSAPASSISAGLDEPDLAAGETEVR